MLVGDILVPDRLIHKMGTNGCNALSNHTNLVKNRYNDAKAFIWFSLKFNSNTKFKFKIIHGTHTNM